MGFKCGILPLIILLNIPGSGSLGQSVQMSCSPQTICALRESAVDLKCSYPNTIKPQQSFWFSSKQKAKWRNEEIPEDLALDSDYAERVTYKLSRPISFSALTIRDLRERDSGEYQLMLITESGEKYSPVLTLTVTDLQIKMISDTDRKWTLNCSTSCSLTSNPFNYYWYNNGQYKKSTDVQGRSWSLYQTDTPASYSCSVSDNPETRSSSVCVSGENCWSVIYSERRVCVLEGSSVDFPCTYSYPSGQTVTRTFWFNVQPKVDPKDLSEEEQFAGRVEFLGDKERNCTLRIKNVTKRDSGEYQYRFINNKEESFSGTPGVNLNVTNLQVRSSPGASSEGQTVTLTCSSTCTLPSNPTYIWYKNRQPVTNKPTRYNKLYLESANPKDVQQYSCALGGPEDTTVLKIMTVGAVFFLALVLIAGWIWMRRRKSDPGQLQRSTMESREADTGAVYSNFSVSAMTSVSTQRDASDGQDGVHYASIDFKRPGALEDASPTTLPSYPIEDQDVQYSTVNFRSVDAEAFEDPSQTYNQVQKHKSPK